MDKLLLTAFLTALAGFITFVLSIVKLVNEKESKTTDYRQSWTDSVRTCLASLIAKLNASAAAMANHKNLASQMNEMLNAPVQEENTDGAKRAKDFAQEALTTSLEQTRQLRKEVYEAYALARLHFKPHEPTFIPVEHKFDSVMSMLRELGDTSEKDKREALKEKIHGEVNEITGYCRELLKQEWETVKRGEPTYEKTKRYSIYGGVFTLIVLVAIGIHAGIAAIRGSGATSPVNIELSQGQPQMRSSSSLEQSKSDKNCPSIEINVSNASGANPSAVKKTVKTASCGTN